MPFDFKQDIQEYEGQQQPDSEPGNVISNIGLAPKKMGDSPVKSPFNFEEDIKQYNQLENAPATEQVQIKELKEKDERIKAQEERNRQMEEDLANAPSPTDEIGQHVYRSPNELTPTSNIEIDYSNVDLTEGPYTQIPDGTVGGHCGVYAENIVKLPGKQNWLVGDTIQEKTRSVDKYREAGLAFKPGEDVPKAGHTIIQNPGTKWGHVAVINDIDENGVATLTESNWNHDKRVTNTRKIRLDDPTIVGFIKTE
jgi:hypothetical protein